MGVSRRLIGCLVVAALSLTAGCSRLVDTFLYFPEKGPFGAPGAVGLEYEDVWFPAADGTELHGWWVPGRREGPCVVFFHGNAGNVSHRLDILRRLYDRVGLGVLLFDYRGYGRSGGTPTEQGLYSDARGARSLVRARGWDRGGAILYGRSLGAAVALQSASEAKPSGCVLESAFTSVEDMARHHYPVLSHLLMPWLRGQFPSLERVRHLECPTLFLHGDQDKISPIGMGWRLFDAASEPKRFRTIRGAGHDDLGFVGGDDYWTAWEEFVKEVEAKRASTTAADAALHAGGR